MKQSTNAASEPPRSHPQPPAAVEGVGFLWLLAGWIVGRSRLLLLLLAVATAALAVPLRQLKFSYHERNELPADNPDLVFLEDLNRRFGYSEIQVVMLQAADVFTTPVLESLKKLTEELARVREVQAVLSLSNASEMAMDGGALRTVPFLERMPRGAAELAEIKRQALTNPLWVGNLVSADGTVAAINLMLEPLVEERMARNQTIGKIQDILQRYNQPGIQLSMTGLSSLINDALRYTARDTILFGLLAPLVISAILWAIYRNRTSVLLPMCSIPTVMIWTLGPFSLAGMELNPIMTILPTLVAVGFMSNLVQIMGEFFHNLNRTEDRAAAMRLTLRNMFGPCFMAAATTMIGYVSLASTSLSSVRMLGWWGVAGICTSYVLVILLTPSLLMHLPLPRPGAPIPGTAGRKILHRCWLWLGGRLEGAGWKLLAALFVGLLALSLLGMGRLKVETDLSKDLPASAPSVRSLRLLDRKLAGMHTLEICVEGPQDVFKERWAMAALDDLHRYVAAQDGVDKVTSLADLIELMHEKMGGEKEGPPGEHRSANLPDDATLAEYMMMLSASEFAPFLKTMMTEDGAAVRLSARVKSLSTTEYTRLVGKMEDYARERMDKRLKMRTTGVIKLMSDQVAGLVWSQAGTLALSLGLTVLIIMIYFRSAWLGVLCFPPNGLAIFMTLGIMGWCGITLNFATVMTAAVGFGMIVDNTIQLVVRYRRLRSTGTEAREAAAMALLRSGTAMSCASLAITAGFATVACSAFIPVRQFALLIGFTMMAALLADLTMTPALLMRYKPK